MKKPFSLLSFLFVTLLFSANAYASGPLLLQKPSLSKTHISFAYAGDLWTVPRDGGEAHLLTSGAGIKSDPTFSPDGSMIAFSGDYDGNVDVYVMPASGGMPRRLTYHPGVDEVVGWTPDGNSVLFRSTRNSYSRFNRLFTVSLEGGLPHELPLPMAEFGSLSADAKHIAYVPTDNTRRLSAIGWKRYRGGKASHIWIANLSDYSIEIVPRTTSNDGTPMWVGNKVYFLSDRNGPVSLYVYDLKSKKIETVVSAPTDIKSASAGPGAIVYEQFGSLSLLDLPSGKVKQVNVTVPADLPQVRPHFKKVEHEIASSNLSPSGARAVFESHGEILTAPAEKGDVRNLTNTPGVMERDPAWSPDGKWVAYFSDESGEYQLHIKSPDGMGEAKKISLGTPASFFYSPVWSPDSKKIAYTDKRLNLWYVDLAKGTPVKVDSTSYDLPRRTLEPVWSPDSRWIAYNKQLPSHMHVIFAYSLEQGKATQLTDGLSDARFPAFDQKGQYLYFTASTDVGPTTGWLDLSSINRPVSRSVYLMVLRKDQPSPLAPESDEEKAASDEAKPDAEKSAKVEDSTEQQPMSPEDKAKAQDAKPAKAAKAEAVTVRIDVENISQRILALPIPQRDYSALQAGKAGTIFLVEDPARPGPDAQTTLWRFDMSSRKPEKLMEGVNDFTVSFDNKKLLYSKGRATNKKWFITSAAAPAGGNGPSAGGGKPEAALNLARMEVMVDPRAEWKQEYNEVWRIERDFLYDPNLHGLNLAATTKLYEPYLENMGSRIDFSYLLAEMLGEISIGHMYIRTPADPPADEGKVGLLGADYTIENGRYRFSHIYQGENWNPQLRAPLTQPGANVQQGDYLLAVNGRELKGSDEIFKLFAGTADKSTVLKVSSTPDGKAARNVSVVPIETESALRNRAWIYGNLHKVEEMTAGRVAYVYLPDTSIGGYTSFNRYFFAQVGREAAVVDERFNGGGSIADYVVDYLRRPLQNYFMTREGLDFTTPVGAIFGPKAMIINGYAGSGGDALPWLFRDAKLGPLVGTRTWGGLVGIYDYPQLMDSGSVTAPRAAFYNRNGEWDVENHGVAPDVEVEITPKDWMNGRDPQLEKAVALVMDDLKKTPLPVAKRPAFPNYHDNGAEGMPAAAGAGSSGASKQK
ncbi:MAG: Tol biopolymer transport system-like protein [Acidobacteriaceae bacterium]|nr:Tol biopolymer transport system-like protein [Acidobacteriaceae bacterium]